MYCKLSPYICLSKQNIVSQIPFTNSNQIIPSEMVQVHSLLLHCSLFCSDWDILTNFFLCNTKRQTQHKPMRQSHYLTSKILCHAASIENC